MSIWKTKKKRTNSFPLSPIFEIQTNYKSISPNITVGKNKSNISKQSKKNTYKLLMLENFFLDYSNFVTIWR